MFYHLIIFNFPLLQLKKEYIFRLQSTYRNQNAKFKCIRVYGKYTKINIKYFFFWCHKWLEWIVFVSCNSNVSTGFLNHLVSYDLIILVFSRRNLRLKCLHDEQLKLFKAVLQSLIENYRQNWSKVFVPNYYDELMYFVLSKAKHRVKPCHSTILHSMMLLLMYTEFYSSSIFFETSNCNAFVVCVLLRNFCIEKSP